MIDFTPFARFGLLLVRPTMLVADRAAAWGGMRACASASGFRVAPHVWLSRSSVTAPVDLSLVEVVAVVAREMAIGFAMALAIRALHLPAPRWRAA
ncbi:MAG: hypothetical protein U0Q11_01885 [Vicinamibacterales bacterium]